MYKKLLDSKLLLARDYSSLIEWSISKIPLLTPDWTDFSITAPEMIWLSSACYAYDLLNYELDRKFLNNQIRFSRSFDNLLNMCTLNGVDVRGFLSSSVLIHVVFDSTSLPVSNSISLYKGNYLTVYDANTNRTIKLILKKDYTINYGGNLIECWEGDYKELPLDKDDFTSVGTYVIDEPSIGHNTINLMVLNTPWRLVSDAFLITDNVPSYSIHVYNENSSIIKLSPGYKDIIGTNPISIDYVLTNGFDGTVSSASVLDGGDNFIDEYATNVKNNIVLTINSILDGYNSYDLAGIKSLLGTTSSNVSTLVIENDYVDMVQSVDYVYSCTVKNINNIKQIYFVAERDLIDFGLSNLDIIDSINDKISPLVPTFTQYNISPMITRYIGLDFTVYLSRNELDLTGLRDIIQEYISSIFDRKNVKGGMEFSRSVISIGIEDLSSSISYVVFKFPIMDIFCNWNEILDIDSLIISFERG